MITEYDEICARCGQEGAIHVLDTGGVMDLDEAILAERVCSTIGDGVYLHPQTETDAQDTELLRREKLTDDPGPWGPRHLDGASSLAWAELLESIRREGTWYRP